MKECLTVPAFLVDKYNQLNHSAKKVLLTLLTGEHFSVVELTELTQTSDPRSSIRYIRDIGIPVADYWIYTDQTRFKAYFIHDVKGDVL